MSCSELGLTDTVRSDGTVSQAESGHLFVSRGWALSTPSRHSTRYARHRLGGRVSARILKIPGGPRFHPSLIHARIAGDGMGTVPRHKTYTRRWSVPREFDLLEPITEKAELSAKQRSNLGIGRREKYLPLTGQSDVSKMVQ